MDVVVSEPSRKGNRARGADGNLDLMRAPLKLLWALVYPLSPSFISSV